MCQTLEQCLSSTHHMMVLSYNTTRTSFGAIATEPLKRDNFGPPGVVPMNREGPADTYVTERNESGLL